MELVEKESLLVVGIQVQATYKQLWKKMPESWDLFFSRLDEIPNRKNDVCMDISFGENQYGIYTQFIGAEVAETTNDVPEGMQKIEIASGEYLHHIHSGSLEEIADTFGEIYDWAKNKDIHLGEFKLDTGYTPSGQEKQHDLYIQTKQPK